MKNLLAHILNANIMVLKSSCQASLRSKKAGNHVYKIPYGDWFEYVSAAHYFAEFVSIDDSSYLQEKTRVEVPYSLLKNILCGENWFMYWCWIWVNFLIAGDVFQLCCGKGGSKPRYLAIIHICGKSLFSPLWPFSCYFYTSLFLSLFYRVFKLQKNGSYVKS